MKEPASKLHTLQFTEIVQHIIRLKPRLRGILPEDLAHIKARLDKSHPDGHPANDMDYALLYQVGVILARQQEPLTMGELSKVLDVPLSTATRIVDWLVKNDFVERLPDPEDRRIVRVALTATGHDMLESGNEYVRKRVEHLLYRFTPEERENLVFLLGKLVDALEEQG